MFELTISLNDKSEIPLYEQIYSYIKQEIKQGVFPSRTRMPSTRKLSEHLGISRTTVQMAYDQLMSEGYLEAEPCRGYFVSELDTLIDLGAQIPEEEKKPEEEKSLWDVDFSLRGIDLESFPYGIWRKLAKTILIDANKEMFGSGDNQGDYSLRKAICQYLLGARGVICEPEQIIVGAGSEYLLMLLGQILDRTTWIGMESPTYLQAYRVLDRVGKQIVPIPMDENGISIGELEKSGAESVYVMPSHQFPTGVVMPIRRRMELLAWAGAKEERFIIEDDYDSEFRYKGKPIPALQSADRKGKVIYLGTFSKSVAPGIRISYMMLPRTLLKRYKKTCSFYASTVSRIDQAVMAEFLSGGYYERHLNKMRSIYKAKHDILLDALEPIRSSYKISGENAGIHLIISAKDASRSEADMVKAAKEEGVRIYGMSDYDIAGNDSSGPGSVLLGYAMLNREQIERGAEKICRAFR